MRTKETCHGLPPSRAKGGYSLGTLPDPASVRLLLDEARNATLNPPNGKGANRRSDVSGTAPKQSCKGRGRFKACGTASGPRHRASRGYSEGGAGTVSVYRGTVAGDGYGQSKSETTTLTYLFWLAVSTAQMVPMPQKYSEGGVAGGAFHSTHTAALWFGWLA